MLGQVLRRATQSTQRAPSGTGSVPCIAADDVDAALENAEKHGGRAHGHAFNVPGIGRFGLMTDSDGNLIAVRERE